MPPDKHKHIICILFYSTTFTSSIVEIRPMNTYTLTYIDLADTFNQEWQWSIHWKQCGFQYLGWAATFQLKGDHFNHWATAAHLETKNSRKEHSFCFAYINNWDFIFSVRFFLVKITANSQVHWKHTEETPVAGTYSAFSSHLARHIINTCAHLTAN